MKKKINYKEQMKAIQKLEARKPFNINVKIKWFRFNIVSFILILSKYERGFIYEWNIRRFKN